MLLPQELIRIKRDGGQLSVEQLRVFVGGLVDGSVSQAQAAAFAMAVCLRGMSSAECAAFTAAMAGSGVCLDWSSAGLDGPVVDKHSTGGVGDKVSLMLAPLVAACGAFVPMISGRGLGHTGGTLDKLASIPGYDIAPDAGSFRRVVSDAGCAIIGQTSDLAPADRVLYAVRDVTATVESVPLITASILSKKLAAGLDSLVMDVKFGSGAFMASVHEATVLASSIVDVAAAAGLPATALVTDMNQVLGRTAGNALEVRETIQWLTGVDVDARLDEVVFALGAEMLVLGGLAGDLVSAREQLVRARASGEAAERFARMVVGLGGPSDLLDDPDRFLGRAPVVMPVTVDDGVVASVDARAVGMAVVTLGGGRRQVSDDVDPLVGFSSVAGVGETVGPDRPLAFVHARSVDMATAAADALRAAVTVAASGSVISAGAPVAGRVQAGRGEPGRSAAGRSAR